MLADVRFTLGAQRLIGTYKYLTLLHYVTCVFVCIRYSAHSAKSYNEKADSITGEHVRSFKLWVKQSVCFFYLTNKKRDDLLCLIFCRRIFITYNIK